MNRFHAALSPEAWTGIGERTTEHGYRIVNAAWVTVQNLFCYKRPTVDFFCEIRGESSTTVVREVYVPWV